EEEEEEEAGLLAAPASRGSDGAPRSLREGPPSAGVASSAARSVAGGLALHRAPAPPAGIHSAGGQRAAQLEEEAEACALARRGGGRMGEGRAEGERRKGGTGGPKDLSLCRRLRRRSKPASKTNAQLALAYCFASLGL
ncbi:unnamed protein product, partial [Prorocentrum cordatum]